MKVSLRLEPAQPPIWFRSILPLLAVLITFLLTAGLLLLLRANPLEGYYYFLISGGIAGLAGVSEVAGIHYHLIDAIPPGYGYTGIIVATLGSLHAVGITIAALFIGLIDTGAQTISRAMGVPSFLGDVIQATLLLVTLAVLLLQRYRITLKG